MKEWDFDKIVARVKRDDQEEQPVIRELWDLLDTYSLGPIQTLVPLLYLSEKPCLDITDCFGALHVLTLSISPLRWLLADRNISVMGPISEQYKEEYAIAWKGYLATCFDLDLVRVPMENPPPQFLIVSGTLDMNTAGITTHSKRKVSDVPIEEEMEEDLEDEEEEKPHLSEGEFETFTESDDDMILKLIQAEQERLNNSFNSDVDEPKDDYEDPLRKNLSAEDLKGVAANYADIALALTDSGRRV